MALKTELLSTSAGYAMPVQQWQADAAAPAETPPAETPPAGVSADDAFAKVFDELAHEEPQTTITKPAAETPPAGETQTGETPADGLPDPKTVAATAVTTEPDAAAAAAAASAKAATDAAAAAAAAAAKTTPAQPDPTDPVWQNLRKVLTEQPKQVDTPKPPPYTEEEQKVVDTYQKEWPELYTAEMLIRRTEYRELAGYIFDQVGRSIGPVINDLVETVRGQSQRAHLSDLQTAVPDYSTVRDQVTAWAETQPAFLKSAYKTVIEKGSSEDVTALVAQWRKDTNTPAPAAVAAPAAAAAGVAKPVAGARAAPAKAVIDALKPTGSKRTNVEQPGIASDDYNGAFEAFAAQMGR